MNKGGGRERYNMIQNDHGGVVFFIPNREKHHLILCVFLMLAITTLPCFAARTYITGNVPGGEYTTVDVPDSSLPDYWYDQYETRETISDQLDLVTPTQEHVGAWKKKNLSMPYPPRYKKRQQTKHEREVWEMVQAKYKSLLSVTNKIELAYVEYVRYGLDVKKVNDVCDKLRAATQIQAWKDAWERMPRVREKAKKELSDVISSVSRETDGLFKLLVDIKKKEYDMWARNHPQAAMNITIKRRLSAAEQRAEDAEWAARNAERRASAAEKAANEAAIQAANAEARAAAAQNDAAAAQRRANNVEIRNLLR